MKAAMATSRSDDPSVTAGNGWEWPGMLLSLAKEGAEKLERSQPPDAECSGFPLDLAGIPLFPWSPVLICS